MKKVEVIQKEEMIDLVKVFKSDKAIAELYGVSKKTIFRKRKKLGVVSGKANNPKRDRGMYQMYKEGAKVKEISKAFSMSITQTYRILNKYIKG
jgi:transposase